MIEERTIAILLFTSYFGKVSNRDFKPLSVSEWNRLVRWLQTKDINPEDFFYKDINLLLSDFHDKTIDLKRVHNLLERKSSLAIALEKWSKVGVWIINRGDNNYPKKLKAKLKHIAPPILYGVGNISLLDKNYIGVVGSRKTTHKELEEAKSLGYKISQNGFGVVSGAAKGVDESAMLGALEKGGFSLGFVSDSLIRKSTTSIFRNYIINNKLCLLSPYNPEAGFNVGNAMSRNKLIYTQSSATIIVKSDIKGGTWEGAKENFKKNWSPLWVVDNNEKGNLELVKLGANRLYLNKKWDFESLIQREGKSIQTDLFSSAKSKSNDILKIRQSKVTDKKQANIDTNEPTFFELFMIKFDKYYGDKEVTKKELVEKFGLTKSQLEAWLKKGLDESLLLKNTRPVSYKINPKRK